MNNFGICGYFPDSFILLVNHIPNSILFQDKFLAQNILSVLKINLHYGRKLQH